MKTAERNELGGFAEKRGARSRSWPRSSVSPARSISLWVRDIELTEEQYGALRRRMGGRIDGSRGKRCRALERRREAQDVGQGARARRGDLLHAAGCMLFWAEGSRERGMRSSSSTPIRRWSSFFLTFLRRCFAVPDQKVRRHVQSLRRPRRAAARDRGVLARPALGLPRACLRKSTVNRYSKYSQKKRRNKLPYGTCRLSRLRHALVQHIYGAIQEYGGFEREEWLM